MVEPVRAFPTGEGEDSRHPVRHHEGKKKKKEEKASSRVAPYVAAIPAEKEAKTRFGAGARAIRDPVRISCSITAVKKGKKRGLFADLRCRR